MILAAECKCFPSHFAPLINVVNTCRAAPHNDTLPALTLAPYGFHFSSQ